MKTWNSSTARSFGAGHATAQTGHGGAVDVHAINATIEQALASAGLGTRTGPMKNVMDTIQQALSSAGLDRHAKAANTDDAIIEGVARRVDAAAPATDRGARRPDAPTQGRAGQFLDRAYTNAAGTRTYKLYVPAGHADASGEPMPMVVMLHGCTQSPDDFAIGTQMNALADRYGFLVVYPAQSRNANGSNCWNWFRSEDQLRDVGEPSLIVGITRAVMASHRVDPRRVFVAGLSAGAAMAVILGATYPDVYAAVGAHSGLPYAAAHDMPSAFAAMQGKGVGGSGNSPPPSRARGPHAPRKAMPTIVFHGDNDHTVDSGNGGGIVRDAVAAWSDSASLRAIPCERAIAGGRGYSRTTHVDAGDRVVVEHWILHGAGHAWSGGNAQGSFTDATGPSASAEMLRFFQAQP